MLGTGSGTLDGRLPTTAGVAGPPGTEAPDRRGASGLSICREPEAGNDAQV